MERPSVGLRRPARLLRLASDERLVELVRSGDEGAFEALYDRHHPAILGFCRHMLGTREEAEDALQHTFLAAFRDLTRHEQPIDLRPWLFAIARNRCLSLLRARRAHVELDLAEPSTDGLAATVERREDLRELLADLAGLPEDQRAALLLAELGALDHAGIATVLGCPREKVKALVFQARTSLAASREARATPCEQIRIELATASGAALRRGALRRHLRACAGCQAFKAEVATQRRLLALALPVIPSVTLKAGVIAGGVGAATSGGSAATATTAAATSNATGGALGGLLGPLASTGAGKAVISLAVAGAVASGGALSARLEHRAIRTPTPTPSADAAAPRLVPWQPSTLEPQPATRPARGSHRATPIRHGVRRPLEGRHGGDAAPRTAPAPLPAPSHAQEEHAVAPAVPAPATQVVPPPARRRSHRGSPAPGPWTPPGHADEAPRETSPWHGKRTTPGHGSTPPGRGGTPPGRANDEAPGHGGTPPGHAKSIPPGQAKRLDQGAGGGSGAPGTGGGASGQLPGESGGGPATGAGESGTSSEAHGKSGAAPGHNK